MMASPGRMKTYTAGGEENQNRGWNDTIWNERPMNCVAVRPMRAVASAAHTKIGMRQAVIPGARIRTVVTMMFSEPRMDERPIRYTPQKNICIPSGARALSGG